MAPLLRFDAYAFVTAAGVAGLGFMLTYHFKRDLSEWEWGDWGYALAAAVYVYFRNVGRHEMTEVVGASSEASREEHPEDSGTAANVKKIKAAPLIGSMVMGEPVVIGKGCIIALFFWDSREKQSRLLIHPMSALARRYPPLSSPRVHVVGVSPEPPERVGAYLQGLQRSIDFTALADKDGSLSSAYTRAHGNQRTPHAYLINGSGFVEWHGHPTQLESALYRLLDSDESDS